MRKVRTFIVALLLAGFIACAVADDARGEGLVLSKGCYSATDIANASIRYGFRSWYAAKYDGTGKYGLTSKDGVFRYVSVVAFAGNASPVLVTRYKRYGTGDAAYVVATDYFGPGGGFADYVACDSIYISKAAADTISYKLCW